MTSPLPTTLQDLIADVLATAEAESTTTPETFTRRALDDLEQAGVTENTFAAYHRARGIEVSGYGSNESLGTLDVFITYFRQSPQSHEDGKAEVDTLFRRVLDFVQRCRDGLRQQIDESDDVYDMCLGVEKKLPEAPGSGLFLLTNSDRDSHARRPRRTLGDLPVSYEIWDLTRFHRMATSGTLSEPIVVEFSDPLPCLATPATGPGLLRLPGDPAGHRACPPVRPVRHSAAGTERPVVPPDQGRGQPRHPRHAAHRPERFLAYNNGITATASHVEFTALPGRRQGYPPHP